MIENASEQSSEVIEVNGLSTDGNTTVFWAQDGILGWLNDKLPMRILYPGDSTYLESYWDNIMRFNILADLIILMLFCCFLMNEETKRYTSRENTAFYKIFEEPTWFTNSVSYSDRPITNFITFIVNIVLCGLMACVCTAIVSFILFIISMIIYNFGFVLAIPVFCGVLFIIRGIYSINKFNLWVWIKKSTN